MRVEIVAIGTELLLGQIADTNSAWLGEHLALAGVDSHYHQAVGDNHQRILLALRTALARSDAVIICGGLGPTQDDITREAIAEIMGVELERHEDIVELIRSMFGSRGRTMPENNLRQADVPRGASVIPQTRGTAPGLICPLGNKVIYAVPGVPYEMEDMFERAILPDLRARMGVEGAAVITSRVLRTWGAAESALAEAVASRFEHHETAASGLTVAFLASGIEGIKVRLTAKAPTEAEAEVLLHAEELEVRRLIEDAFGDIIFGVDDESMEHAVAALLLDA
jgi:nicotinamide-nucleotide amidase